MNKALSIYRFWTFPLKSIDMNGSLQINPLCMTIVLAKVIMMTSINLINIGIAKGMTKIEKAITRT